MWNLIWLNTPRPTLRTVHGPPSDRTTRKPYSRLALQKSCSVIWLSFHPPSSFARQTGTRMAHIGASRNRPHPPAPVHSPVPLSQFKHLAPSFSRTKIGPMRHFCRPVESDFERKFRDRGPKSLKVSRTRDLGANLG